MKMAATPATIAAALNGAAGTIGSLRPQGPDLIMGDRRLAPVNIRRQPFRVASAGLSISAELASPHAALARASVLLVYGSGPATKAAFDPWALWFLSQDMNVITHDSADRASPMAIGGWPVWKTLQRTPRPSSAAQGALASKDRSSLGAPVKGAGSCPSWRRRAWLMASFSTPAPPQRPAARSSIR